MRSGLGERRRPALALLAVLVASVVLGGCPKKNEPVVNQSETTATPAPTVDKDKDQEAAKTALVVAADLPGSGWKKSTTATTAKKGNNSNAGSSFDCPELGDAFSDAESDKIVRVVSPQYERKTPYMNVEAQVVVLASEAEAKRELDDLDPEDAKTCFKRGFSHENAKDGKSGTTKVTDWKIGKLGDSRIAFDIFLSQETDTGTVDVHVGFAVIRVGRAYALIALGTLDPLSDDAKAIAVAATDKLRENQP